MTLNVANAVKIFISTCGHVHNTVDRQGTRTFSAIESEIPPFATSIATVDSQGASPVNMQGCIRERLGEDTVL